MWILSTVSSTVIYPHFYGIYTLLHKPTAPTTITAEINYIFIYLGSAFFTSFRKEVINNHEAAIPEGRHCKWYQHRYESRSIQDNHVYFRVYPDRRFFQRNPSDRKRYGTRYRNKGKIALDAKLFSEITRRLSSQNSTITIESDQKLNTTIRCENSVFNIQGRDGEEFTYIPYIERDKYITLSQFTLKEVIQQTIFSISPNDSNKMMGGELFEVNENQLKVVSLDGHRISIRNVTLKDHYEPTKVIVPGKTLSEISKILGGDNEKEVRIFFSSNHILFEFDDTIVVSRLIEGEYFRINQMLSSDYETKFSVTRREFLDCIERATILIRENDKKPLILQVNDNTMELKLNSSFGSMNAELLIHKTGKDIMIGFNPKFLIDALRAIEDEEINIYMMNPKSPCFIKDEEETYIYLILPVNFNAASV